MRSVFDQSSLVHPVYDLQEKEAQNGDIGLDLFYHDKTNSIIKMDSFYVSGSVVLFYCDENLSIIKIVSFIISR